MEKTKSEEDLIKFDLTNINIKEFCVNFEKDPENLTKEEIDEYFLKITNSFLKISAIQSVLDDIKNNLFNRLNKLENLNSLLKNQDDNFDILNENNKSIEQQLKKNEIEEKTIKEKRGRKKKVENVEEKTKETNKNIDNIEEKTTKGKRGRKKKVENIEETTKETDTEEKTTKGKRGRKKKTEEI